MNHNRIQFWKNWNGKKLSSDCFSARSKPINNEQLCTVCSLSGFWLRPWQVRHQEHQSIDGALMWFSNSSLILTFKQKMLIRVKIHCMRKKQDKSKSALTCLVVMLNYGKTHWWVLNTGVVTLTELLSKTTRNFCRNSEMIHIDEGRVRNITRYIHSKRRTAFKIDTSTSTSKLYSSTKSSFDVLLQLVSILNAGFAHWVLGLRSVPRWEMSSSSHSSPSS